MKHIRLMFVALVVGGILMGQSPVDEPIDPQLLEAEAAYFQKLDEINEALLAAAAGIRNDPEMPEPQPWFSFLDQNTGTWKREYK